MALYKRIPTQIVIAAYHKEDGAEKALLNLVEAVADEQIVCTNVAIVAKNEKGKVLCKELGKPGFIKGLVGGTTAGATAGAAIGGAALSILGKVGVAAGSATGGLVGGSLGAVKGAVIGSAGKVCVESMDKDNLKSLGSALIPTTSAIVAVFSEVIVKKHKFHDGLKERKESVDKVVAMMAADITEKLKNESDCAYHLAITEDGAVFSQVTMNCFTADFKQMIITPDAASAKHVAVSPEGTAVEEVVVTGEGVAGAAAVSTNETVEYEAEDIEYET